MFSIQDSVYSEQMNSKWVLSDPSPAVHLCRPEFGSQLVTEFTKKCALLIFIHWEDYVKTQKLQSVLCLKVLVNC